MLVLHRCGHFLSLQAKEDKDKNGIVVNGLRVLVVCVCSIRASALLHDAYGPWPHQRGYVAQTAKVGPKDHPVCATRPRPPPAGNED